jgi:hypothetical protein
MLLTYNAPGGKELWAAMTEAEQPAEEDEYRDLIRSMRDGNILIASDEVEHFDAARTARVLLLDRVRIDCCCDQLAAKIPNARSGWSRFGRSWNDSTRETASRAPTFAGASATPRDGSARREPFAGG